MKTRFYFLITFGFLLLCHPTYAQQDLCINKLFDKYGKKKGSVMVDLSGEIMLKDYDMTLFKSLTIQDNAEAGNIIRDCLTEDQKGAKKIKQVVTNGVITSVYLELPPKDDIYRLILFKEATNPELITTLIYIESKNDSGDVLNIILQKK